MGCGSSRPLSEADAYAQRKKNGFKDPGLERHRVNCVKQKKKLRHVEAPKTTKISMRERKQNKVSGRQHTVSGLDAGELKNVRKNLRKT